MNRRENVAMTLACDLASELVRTFGGVRLRVFGTSMVPFLFPGDLIWIQKADLNGISTGEIVLFSREGRLIAHRVVAHAGSAEQTLLVTRGDRLNHDDHPVSSSEFLGRVTIAMERRNFMGHPSTSAIVPPSGALCTLSAIPPDKRDYRKVGICPRSSRPHSVRMIFLGLASLGQGNSPEVLVRL
jgi:signal peptidase I